MKRPLARAVIAVFLLATGWVVAAFATPKLAQSTCIAYAQDYLRTHPVHGRTLNGQIVPASPDDMVTKVEGPFQTSVWYSVPRHLHATVYVHQCHALPWKTTLGERKALHLV
ncbi:hypothetical protein [Pseudoxanthomonas indica]|uniref:Uncharacterized protein n=1 Tax=Pseudoxanthomonas indica TaxID=428993 RepID=A0A1T5JVJ7_9GAMM|nr:hypothetical protein [Pseudoxanthomonas indica]SKC55385.1 hypothetical protein SAMN06296058_1121 [Pseudoxanthomonas indica]